MEISSLKFVSMGPIKDTLPLIQTMAWWRTDDKPLSKPLVAYLIEYTRHSVSKIWKIYLSYFCINW